MLWMRKYLQLTLFWQLVLLAPGLAADGPDRTRNYSLALFDHGLLYSEQTGKGIDRDFADELIRRSHCKFTVSVLPRSRIWQLIETGALDFSTSGITLPERQNFADFAWYFIDKYYLLVRTDAKAPSITDFTRNPQLKLGAIRGYRYSNSTSTLIDRLSNDNRVSFASSIDTLYQIMALNRIQGIIIEPFDLAQVASSPLRKVSTIIEFEDAAVLHGLIMSKKTIPEDERRKWQSLVEGMRQDGTILKIFGRYFSPDIAETLVHF